MSLDQKAIRFVENLAGMLLKEEHGVVLSQKDQKRLFKETISSLSQGKLQRELRKYSPLYFKRFQRCVKRLRQRLVASEGSNVSHSETTSQISEDNLRSPTTKPSSDIRDEKQGNIASVPAQQEEKSCSSVETNNSTHDGSKPVNQISSYNKPSSICVHSPRPVHSRLQQLDLMRRKKTSCLGKSGHVNDLTQELTKLYHHSDPASLINKMNRAVGLFSAEVADIVTSKAFKRASDVASSLHSVMLYFHFKCDILHTHKKQVSFCRDSAYRQHMASMLSLSYTLSILITRSDSERRIRTARRSLFKACMLLDQGHELMMDILLQLSVKAESTDAPYLYPTLMYVLKNPPYPFTPSTYIKHVLVCRLARCVLPSNQYPDLTEQLQSSLTLLPPSNLSAWLTEHCPHLTSEMPAYVKGHQMTSYLLQVASYDLCHELQKGLYSRPGSATLCAGMESSGKAEGEALRTSFSGAVERDTADIEEHCEVDLEGVTVIGNHHTTESNISGDHQDVGTESKKPAEHSGKAISKDVGGNVHKKTPTMACKEVQEDTSAEASGVSKRAKRISRKKPSTAKALPLAGKLQVGEVGRNVLAVAKESGSDGKPLKCLASATCTDKSLKKQQDMPQGQMSPSLNQKEKEHVADHHTPAGRKNMELEENKNESLLKQQEQDLQQAQISAIPPGLNMNKIGLIADCRRSAVSKNTERLERNKSREECDTVVPDSCDDETGSVDIIYSSETEHSDHLQQKMALRKARHLRNLLPSTESSKSGVVSDSSRIMTRSKYKERLSDVGTVYALREEGQRKDESITKEREQAQAVSPIFKDCMPFEIEGIPVRLVHIDRNRGSVGTPEELESICGGEEDFSVFMKHASQIRSSLDKLDAFKFDSKNKAGETPKGSASLHLSEIGSNVSRVDSSLKTSPREFNLINKSESTSSPNKLDVASKQKSQKQVMSENLVDFQKSVISSDCADVGLSASTRIAPILRRSPRKSTHKSMAEDVPMKLPVDEQKSPVFHSTDRKLSADSKQAPNLRRSLRKGNQKEKLESIANEQVTDHLGGDPYELIVSSDSAGDDSKASPKRASRRSFPRGNSPAEPQFPLGTSSCRDKVTELKRSSGPGHPSFKRSVDTVQKKQGPVRNEEGQHVPAKNGSSHVVLKVQKEVTSPPSLKSSLSKFRSLRKRSFSEGCDEQSAIPSKLFTSLRGSSEELGALRSRASLKKIGVVPPYTQVCDSRSPKGQSSAGQKTSLGGRSPGSQTTYKDSPRSSKINSKQGPPTRSFARIRLVRKALEFT